jgi:hypothetical protein
VSLPLTQTPTTRLFNTGPQRVSTGMSPRCQAHLTRGIMHNISRQLTENPTTTQQITHPFRLARVSTQDQRPRVSNARLVRRRGAHLAQDIMRVYIPRQLTENLNTTQQISPPFRLARAPTRDLGPRPRLIPCRRAHTGPHLVSTGVSPRRVYLLARDIIHNIPRQLTENLTTTQ